MTIQVSNFPTVMPALTLDLTRSQYLDPRITFTRASSGTVTNSAGQIVTATTNEARFDHNPVTGESLGLLVEEQRTNSIRNNTMVGAVAGTPGTDPTNWITTSVSGAVTAKQIVGVGTESGITYIDLRYTTDGAITFNACVFEQATQIAAASGQTWTGSAYLKLAGGSLSNLSFVHRVMYRTAVGGSVTTNDVAFTPTSAALGQQRSVNTFAASGGTIAAVTNQLVVTATGASDITLRVGLPQLEQGAFATSPIPTTTAAVTRSADVVSITGSAFSSWYRADEGTVFVAGVSNGANGSGFFTLEDGSAAEYSRLGVGFSFLNFIVSKASGTQSDVYSTGTSFVFGSPFRGVAAYALNNVGLSLNGASAQVDTTADMPSAANALRIGFGKYSAYANGTIRRLTYWPQRLSNASLQTLTQ